MKKTIYFVILVVVIVFGIYLVRQHGNRNSVNPVFTTTAPDGHPAFSIVMKHISESGPKGEYEITAEYPVVSGLAQQSASDAINKSIYSTIQADIDSFKQDISGSRNSPEAFEDQTTLSIVVATSTPRRIPVISFIVDQETYLSGAAHPGNTIEAFNFDSTTGNAVTLGNLFIGNYLKVLSDYSKKVLPRQLGDNTTQGQINEGASADADNFKVVVPEDDGVHIIFNEYQVAAYVAGPQEITVPYSVLSEVINPAGPLKGLK